MDKISHLASKVGGHGGHSSGSGSGAGARGQEDYVDKGLDSVEKKFGGGKVDPVKMRSTNEKITDAGRGQFEKSTGKHVPAKISN
ncbi:hypothetical protein N7475_000079 [Penicillium sp. IBT 31633x]|nr:hypothetical protein N7475_000079 [Penicillium sp. IBT 31633x]